MTDGSNIRVRFAPSPTGYLHVGGARTAIFNWLFARHHGGAFVLRIEDTDQERSTRESEHSLLEDLRWLGLDWDEGPDAGGPYGPYRQSERLDLYQKSAAAIVAAGGAYPCFCTDEALEAKRQDAIRRGVPPQYDGTCRDLTPEAVAARRQAGTPEVVRFRVPEEEIVIFDDIVRGSVEFATKTVGDFVLMRSNGHPTYNFAAAHDDHMMRITHVLRGEEHLPNTLRQILIYRALGGTLPHFAHLPLILAEDRSKLSKRHGASSVGELMNMGFLSDAVVNYLVLLGWSHPDSKEVVTRKELTDAFTLERVNKSAAVYDPKKLRWMNGQYVRAMSLDDLCAAAERFLPEDIRAAYSSDDRREILRLLHDSIESLGDLDSLCAPFRTPPVMEPEAVPELTSETGRTVLAAFAERLAALGEPLTAEAFKALMKEVQKATGIKGKALFFPVRAALTGSVHGPDLAGIAALRGVAGVRGLVRGALGMRDPR
jgi:glutamyl-tRNA synthetase